MEFVDYYAVLNLHKSAKESDVQAAFDHYLQNPLPDHFDISITAYATLSNPYRRERYDKTFGHLLVIQVEPFDYYNATCYQLKSIQPYASFQALIEKFKEFIFKKYDFDWNEALKAGYSYHLENHYLMLRFPNSSDLDIFSKMLIELKLIRN